MKKQKTERIDVYKPLKENSHNVSGHEERMQAHCERVENERAKHNDN